MVEATKLAWVKMSGNTHTRSRHARVGGKPEQSEGRDLETNTHEQRRRPQRNPTFVVNTEDFMIPDPVGRLWHSQEGETPLGL